MHNLSCYTIDVNDSAAEEIKTVQNIPANVFRILLDYRFSTQKRICSLKKNFYCRKAG